MTVAASRHPRFDPWRWLATPFDHRLRDGFAIVVAAIAFTIGAVAFAFGTVESGVHLELVGTDEVYVGAIDPWSQAGAYGIQPGMRVVRYNEVPLIDFPGESRPTLDGESLGRLLNEPVLSLEAVQPWAVEGFLTKGEFSGVTWVSYATYEWALDESGLALIVGLAILIGGVLWLSSGRGGETLRPLAVPIVVATSVPLLISPAPLTWSPLGIAAAAILWPLGVAPLADGLSGLIRGTDARRSARLLAGVAVVFALIFGLLTLAGSGPTWLLAWITGGIATFIPGLIAARPVGLAGPPGAESPTGRVVESTELAVVGATPFIAAIPFLAPGNPPTVLPLLLWIAILLAAQRFTVRPLARIATRAALQRDLVVAATETERARIAANLHDDALQDLTILVRRLDAAGDTESAESARRIAERLRTITGELRLPILDDLGVGPALEWLVSRMERLAGGEIRLERDDGSRLPPDVELAFFRVAQEALANAVRHGRPPIVVRYRVAAGGATLTVDDAGPGIPAGAAEAAPAAGHFGLLGMQQRAEQIGALLDVRRWPAGGTHVALDWRGR